MIDCLSLCFSSLKKELKHNEILTYEILGKKELKKGQEFAKLILFFLAKFSTEEFFCRNFYLSKEVISKNVSILRTFLVLELIVEKGKKRIEKTTRS